MVTVTTKVEIDAPIRHCFDLARDIGIHTQTVWKHTKEKAIRGVTSGPIGQGQTVTFEATHFGVRQRLTSLITEYREPYLFVDEMQKGAFKKLRHVHEFEEIDGKTVMTDTLSFEAPLGIIGRGVERLVLKEYMRKFLEHRNNELKKLAEQTKSGAKAEQSDGKR
ncbi:SRPBCC family protein [Cohnella cellulosilytica]|uniref:SRPBCC family protein n=1 Tax=Cohnella cellulosilytica TaxID=986710 RepID=A0ABW2FJ68_9BACL